MFSRDVRLDSRNLSNIILDIIIKWQTFHCNVKLPLLDEERFFYHGLWSIKKVSFQLFRKSGCLSFFKCNIETDIFYFIDTTIELGGCI